DGVGSVVITDGKWHHFAAVWDGVMGTRQCYVDGVLDPSVNLTGDFGPMNLAPDHHLGIGTREQGNLGSFESWFNGKLCDVRLYNYPISAADVASLAGVVTVPPTLTVQRWTGNQVRISWPTSFSGYAVHQSSSLTTGWAPAGLTVTVEGAENVAYAPATSSPQFFRLKK
ncbi:MAG TPA: LamG domain-containing protein, partial [Candidatus Sulfotelmatobacter sp.]|nr:LamG domain-containing protein [Candidatus Sulfotelmatobacter sp.]